MLAALHAPLQPRLDLAALLDRAGHQPIGEIVLEARIAQQPPDLALLITEIAQQRAVLRQLATDIAHLLAERALGGERLA